MVDTTTALIMLVVARRLEQQDSVPLSDPGPGETLFAPPLLCCLGDRSANSNITLEHERRADSAIDLTENGLTHSILTIDSEQVNAGPTPNTFGLPLEPK